MGEVHTGYLIVVGHFGCFGCVCDLQGLIRLD